MQESPQERNAAILERLRAAFGEEREGEWSDIDGLGMLARFVRPIARDETQAQGLNRADLAEWRRRRRARRQALETTQPLPWSAESTGRLAQYAELIEDLPRLRAEFADWLASVETEEVPMGSSLEELKALYARAEYRLRVLNLMLAETQRECDALRAAIHAAELEQS